MKNEVDLRRQNHFNKGTNTTYCQALTVQQLNDCSYLCCIGRLFEVVGWPKTAVADRASTISGENVAGSSSSLIDAKGTDLDLF